jgi:4-amino-4-deoxy-L-arabinose transferase-like glycosyltransferase
LSEIPKTWVIAVVVLAAALRVVPIWFGIPFMAARPDEEVAVSIATRITEGDPNPHFFHWPSLTFYVFAGAYWVAAVVRRLFSMDAALTVIDRVLIARTVVALAGTATVLVLFRMGRRVADARTGWLAALFLSVAMLHVRDSHFAMSDVLMTLLLTASLALLLCAVDAERAGTAGVRWFAAAGLLGGLATSTKYNAGAVLGAMAAAQLLLIVEKRRVLNTRLWAPSAAFAVTFALGFVGGSPYSVLDFPKFEEDLRFDVTHLAGGHGVDLGRGWFYHFERSLPYGTGITVFVAALTGVIPLARHYGRHALVLGGFAVPFYVAIGSGTTVFFRYVLPLIPVICLAGAVAVRHLSAWLATRTRLRHSAIVATLVAVTAGPGLVNSIWFDVLLARTDTRVLAADWLKPRLQPGDTLHDAGGEYTKLDLRHVRFHEWRFDADENSFGHPQGHTPDWLVLSESPIRLYASIPPPLRQLAQDRYTLVHTVPATTGRARAAVYDLQDAFFLPFSRFATVVRPGPTIRIYRRADAPPIE